MHIRVPHPWVLGRQHPDLQLVLGERVWGLEGAAFPPALFCVDGCCELLPFVLQSTEAARSASAGMCLRANSVKGKMKRDWNLQVLLFPLCGHKVFSG